MFKNFFKITFRSLWKNKGYSFPNIFGLAIGIACAGLIFLWVEDEVNYNSNNLVAFPVAWWMMHSWLQNYQYRVEISWWIFLNAGLLAIIIALITVSFQAIRAAIANPVKSLRTE